MQTFLPTFRLDCKKNYLLVTKTFLFWRQEIDPISPCLCCLFCVLFSNRDQDLAFTRMFATVKPRPMPIATYVLFTVRDGMTVTASFNMPSPASKYLQERFGMSEKNADVTAQVCTATGFKGLQKC